MGSIRIPMAQQPVPLRRQPPLLRPPGVHRPILPICLILVIPIHITDRVRIRRVLISKDEVFPPPITSNSHRSFWLFFFLSYLHTTSYTLFPSNHCTIPSFIYDELHYHYHNHHHRRLLLLKKEQKLWILPFLISCHKQASNCLISSS